MPETEAKGFSLGWDTAILVCTIGLAVIVWSRLFDYLSGRDLAFEKGIPFGRLLIYAFIGLLLASCAAVMIARTIGHWRTGAKWSNAVRCIIILVVGIGGLAAFACGPPGIYRFADGFAERMSDIADVKAIRTWSNGLAQRDPNDPVPENLWPECVRVLSPRQVYLDDHVGEVRLDWGGGFLGHYGMVIGPEDRLPPRTTESELIVPFEPGAYLFFPRE